MSNQQESQRWDSFTDTEIERVKQHLTAQTHRIIVVGVLTLPLALLITPIMPGKRGKPSLMEQKGFWEAVLYLTPLLCLTWIGIIIWMTLKQNIDFKKIRFHLQKKKTVAKIKVVNAKFFLPGWYKIKLDNEELDYAYLNKEEYNRLLTDQPYELTYEVHTKSIIAIEPTIKLAN